MIVYGLRSSHLQSFDTPVPCPGCGQRNRTVVSVFGRYAHVYWIPLFPVGKTAVAICTYCKANYENKEFSLDLKRDSTTMKASTKAPVWHFLGLGILVVAVCFVAFSIGQGNAQDDRYFADPQPGDRYEYRMQADGKNAYTTFKVASVGEDTLWAYENQYIIDKSTQLDKIDVAANYETKPTALLRSRLTAMREQGDITNIHR